MTDSLPAPDLIGFSRRDLQLSQLSFGSSGSPTLMVKHMGSLLALSTTTMGFRGGQCQVLLTSCSASSAIVQRDVDDWWTSKAILHHGPLPPTCEFMQSARIAFPVSRGPGLSWNSRRALHGSPPNEFDCHDPSGRRLLGQSLTM